METNTLNVVENKKLTPENVDSFINERIINNDLIIAKNIDDKKIGYLDLEGKLRFLLVTLANDIIVGEKIEGIFPNGSLGSIKDNEAVYYLMYRLVDILAPYLPDELYEDFKYEDFKSEYPFINVLLTFKKHMCNTLDYLINTSGAILSLNHTRFPDNHISVKDKVSNSLFDGKLGECQLQEVAIEGPAHKKELTAVVSIDFDELKDVTISRDISPYDREVHDAVVSLYVDGKNECVTPLMIYRTMVGNPKAKLTDKTKKTILNSITKLAGTKIKIDSSREASAYKFDKATYEGNLLFIEKLTLEHKGSVGEWYHLLRKPVLYDYANNKNQIARTPIKLLNTPINKNEDNTILQGYLQRRILAMKGSSKLSKTILFDTVYKYFDLEGKTPGAIRRKQSSIRDNVKCILDYWKAEKFINDYTYKSGINNKIEGIIIEV